MPFNPTQGMGIGPVGLGDPNLVIKRKFRWTLEISRPATANCPAIFVPCYFVKVASRPNVSFEETEINFLNGKTWLPGKPTFEAITVTFMDVAGSLSGDAAGGNSGLFQWLLSVYDFRQSAFGAAGNGAFIPNAMNSRRNSYTAVLKLTLWDGCGSRLEDWIISDAWPQAINFGDLDYASSDTVDIETTIRYSQVNLINYCPGVSYSQCCESCS